MNLKTLVVLLVLGIVSGYDRHNNLRQRDHGNDRALVNPEETPSDQRRRNLSARKDEYERKVLAAAIQYDRACNRNTRTALVTGQLDLEKFDKRNGSKKGGKSRRNLKHSGRDPFRLTDIGKKGEKALREAIGTCQPLSIEQIAASIEVENISKSDERDCEKYCEDEGGTEDDIKKCERKCEKCKEECDDDFQVEKNFERCADDCE